MDLLFQTCASLIHLTQIYVVSYISAMMIM